MKTNRNPIPISYLNAGDSFEFAALKNYRNCKIKRNSDAGTWITAEVKNGLDGLWKALSPGYVVSNQAQVFLIE